MAEILLRELKDVAGELNEHEDEVEVHCPECGTKTWKPNIEGASELACEHDQDKHDGKGVVKVSGMKIPSDDLAQKAAEAAENIDGSGE